jgi:hypothetical protein
MRIFILKFDNTVEVTESFSDHPYYTHKNYQKGQVFCERLVGKSDYWCVLHRDHKGNGPSWVHSVKVPKEVLFARMLVD